MSPALKSTSRAAPAAPAAMTQRSHQQSVVISELSAQERAALAALIEAELAGK
jgi:hypothetical protein